MYMYGSWQCEAVTHSAGTKLSILGVQILNFLPNISAIWFTTSSCKAVFEIVI